MKSFSTQICILSILFLGLLSTNNFYAQGMGVGIAVPVSVLHVYENTTNVSTTAGLTIEQSSTGDAVVQYLLTGGQRWVTGVDNSDADKFKISSTVDVGSAPRIKVQTSGEVGIGTASPSTKLTVSTATSAYGIEHTDGTIRLATYIGGVTPIGGWIGTISNHPLVFFANGSNALMTVATNGNVGIGITAPAGKLHVYESTGTTLTATAGTLILEHNDSGGESSILFKSKVNAGDDHAYIKYSEDGSGNGSTNENGLLEIAVRNDIPGNVYQDDIAIMPSGNLGVNTRTPGSTLHVNGSGRFGFASTTNGSIIFNNSTNANTVTVQSGVTSSGYSLTLPTAQGAANTTLINNGTGVLSWAAAPTGTTRYTIASGATNTFYSDSYIQFRWNTTTDDIQFSPQTGHTGWWDLWQAFELTPDALESGTANSGADDIDAATVGTWYNLNTGFTEGEYGPGGIIYITKEDSNTRPLYKIEQIFHGTYLTFLVTVFP